MLPGLSLIPYFGGAGFDCFDSPVGAEMYVGYKRYIYFLHDLCKSSGVGSSGYGQTYQPAAGTCKLLDLFYAAIYVHRRHLCHRLDNNRAARADVKFLFSFS